VKPSGSEVLLLPPEQLKEIKRGKPRIAGLYIVQDFEDWGEILGRKRRSFRKTISISPPLYR